MAWKDSKTVRIAKEVPLWRACDTCSGEGSIPTTYYSTGSCQDCRGAGITKNHIELAEGGYQDAWKCICGNTPSEYGFYPSSKEGELQEPDEDGPWDGVHYRCDGCGRVIDQKTGEIKGQKRWKASSKKVKVSKRELDIPTSPHLDRALGELHAKGHKSLIVGGAVRDALLGEEPKDVDVEVYGTNYDDLASTLRKHGKVNLVGKQFGVVKFTDPDRNEYDFSLPRRDSKTGIGHRDFETDFDPDITPKEAASRRDFTFNSLAYDPVKKELHDYYGGEQDLKDKVIRHTSDQFAEDPLRVLRGMQFSARYGMSVHPDTAKLAHSIKHEYATIPKERVGEEFMKLATKGKEPGRAIDYLEKTGWHENFPELHAAYGVKQEPDWHPEGDLHTHMAHAMDAAAKIADREGLSGDNRATVVFGAMCHDLGKPSTTAIDERGRTISHGHDTAGGPIARQFLDSIGIKREIADKIPPMVENHMQHLNYAKNITSRSVRRLAERLHPASIKELSMVMEADHSGRPPLAGGLPVGAKKMLDKASESNVTEHRQERIVKGRDVMPYFSGEPGPHIGEHVDAAYEAQLNGEINTPEQGQAWLKKRFEKSASYDEPDPGGECDASCRVVKMAIGDLWPHVATGLLDDSDVRDMADYIDEKGHHDPRSGWDFEHDESDPVRLTPQGLWDGNHRVSAAHLLGWDDLKVPVHLHGVRNEKDFLYPAAKLKYSTHEQGQAWLKKRLGGKMYRFESPGSEERIQGEGLTPTNGGPSFPNNPAGVYLWEKHPNHKQIRDMGVDVKGMGAEVYEVDVSGYELHPDEELPLAWYKKGPIPPHRVRRVGSTVPEEPIRVEMICGASDVDKGHPGYWEGQGDHWAHPGHERLEEECDKRGIRTYVEPSLQKGTWFSDAYAYFHGHQVGDFEEALEASGHPADDITIQGPLSPEHTEKVKQLAERHQMTLYDVSVEKTSSIPHLIQEHGADPQSIDHTNSSPEDVAWVHEQLHLGSKMCCKDGMTAKEHRHKSKDGKCCTDPASKSVEGHLPGDARRQITGSWKDVRNKAVRLRNANMVDIIRLDDDVVASRVQGDHHLYDVVLYRQFPGSWAITLWECSCKWGDWAFKRQVTYVGRMCSHALATLYAAHGREYTKRKPTGEEMEEGDTIQDIADRLGHVPGEFPFEDDEDQWHDKMWHAAPRHVRDSIQERGLDENTYAMDDPVALRDVADFVSWRSRMEDKDEKVDVWEVDTGGDYSVIGDYNWAGLEGESNEHSHIIQNQVPPHRIKRVPFETINKAGARVNKYLYHDPACWKDIPSILKKGLIPGAGSYSWGWTEQDDAVYLSKKPGDYGEGIFKIDTSKLDKSKFTKGDDDDGVGGSMDVAYRGSIPRNAIEQVVDVDPNDCECVPCEVAKGRLGSANKGKLTFYGVQQVTISVEVARDANSITQGLMHRTYLGPREGMVFAYPYPPSYSGFWMMNTLIPLSIAFWDKSGRIIEVKDMEPCPPGTSRCPIYKCSQPYWGAVEVNKGFFRQWGIRPGDRIELDL